MGVRKSKYYLIFVLLLAAAGASGQNWSSNSVLSSGDWYSVKVLDEGMVKIRYEDIVDLGIQPGTVPAIFGNNKGLLSF